MENSLFKTKIALVIIDLQKGIVYGHRALAPHTSKEVVFNASKLAEACRANNLPVFLVHVNPSPETRLKPDADTIIQMKAPDADWAEFVEEMTPKDTDVVITKQQWGAFYGTDLDLQLRRRKIETIILCGISTNIGVESTARNAFELGFNQLFAEDAMAAMSSEEHNNSLNYVFKRMGRVVKTKDILDQLEQ
ncbi:MAG: hydrolase [Candidatus Nanoarchaeia archaeon]